jgi:hypothetical protein
MAALGFWTRLTLGVITALLPILISNAGLADDSSAAGKPQTKAGELPTLAVTVGQKKLTASVANNDHTRRQGLLGWTSITDDQGMLLDYGIEGKHAIHMQGMKFPIDAVWMDKGGVVTLIYPEIVPNSGLTYPSIFSSRYCLELKAGFCNRHGVKIGGRVRFGTR